MTSLSSLPGFREFYPAQLAVRAHISSVWRKVARRYGFVEYDGPPLEPLELYVRKSGAEIVGQLYGFTDRGGREVALRPEMTPTFARMVSARAGALPKPIRWFSIPQLFRYERPQRGRLREHFQLNLDIVGEEGVLADAELVAAAVDVLRAFGLGAGDIVARVSDRRLIGGVLKALGIPEEGLSGTFAVLDRADRESPEKLREQLAAVGATPDAAEAILALGTRSLDALLDRYGGDPLIREAGERLGRLLRHLREFELGEYVAFDAGLVRGLAYYTGMVFEVWERGGKLRAICGGGRYDDLLASLGGKDLPALGFGMGDVVLGELLKDRELLPAAAEEIDDFVVCVSDEQRPLALRVVHRLRDAGRRVVFDLRGRGVGRQFKLANAARASRAIVIGPDEVSTEEVLVREMESGRESRVPLAGLMEFDVGADVQE